MPVRRPAPGRPPRDPWREHMRTCSFHSLPCSRSPREHGLDRIYNVGIGAAAAKIAAHVLADLLARSRSALCDQRDGRHDLTGRAIAALKSIVLDKAGLHGVKAAIP